MAKAAISFTPSPKPHDDTIKPRNNPPSNNNSSSDNAVTSGLKPTPVFVNWKGEDANAMLDAFWRISGGDKDFILTMAAENGSFTPDLKHPQKNKNGSQDYSFGLNDFRGNNSKSAIERRAFINRIISKEASFDEIAKYHWDIYNQKDWSTSCGKKKFCGYNRRHQTEKLFKF